MPKDTKRIVFRKAKPNPGPLAKYAEVYSEKCDELENIIYRISWITNEALEFGHLGVQGYGSPEDVIRAIRKCLVHNQGDFAYEGDDDWEARFNDSWRRIAEYVLTLEKVRFQSKSQIHDFYHALSIKAFSYFVLPPGFSLDKPGARKSSIEEIWDFVRDQFKHIPTDFSLMIFTGKICEEFGIIEPFDPDNEGYTDEKDYFRQTIRNRLRN